MLEKGWVRDSTLRALARGGGRGGEEKGNGGRGERGGEGRGRKAGRERTVKAPQGGGVWSDWWLDLGGGGSGYGMMAKGERHWRRRMRRQTKRGFPQSVNPVGETVRGTEKSDEETGTARKSKRCPEMTGKQLEARSFTTESTLKTGEGWA